MYMQDIVFPQKNEAEFIYMAKKLGYKSLIFIYPLEKVPKKIENEPKIPIKIGILCYEKDIKKAKKLSNLIFVEKDQNLQKTLEKNNNLIIINLENKENRDFIHHRASGLNQVLCSLMKNHEISVAFSLNQILKSENKTKLIGKIKQNIRLCKKYKVKTIFASFAPKPHEMRNYTDLKSFFNTL